MIRQKGSALVISIFVIILVGVLAKVLLTSSISQTDMLVLEYQKTQADQLVEVAQQWDIRALCPTYRSVFDNPKEPFFNFELMITCDREHKQARIIAKKGAVRTTQVVGL